MSEPITITATVAVWVSKGYGVGNLRDAVERKNEIEVVEQLAFYGKPQRKEFADWVRAGEADVTVRLIPRDEQVKLAVQALQAQLAEERVKWHERQEAILAEISKLSALEYVEAA
jgi:hypothetical protein